MVTDTELGDALDRAHDDIHTPIEQTVKVYLEHRDGAWHVSSASFDGYPLDSSLEGGSACDAKHLHAPAHPLHDQHAARHDAADAMNLPNSAELLDMLESGQ